MDESRLDTTSTLWAPYLEWTLPNASYAGNPFDVVATATFEHAGSGAAHTTEMFYDGADAWSFRFTGTRTGRWTFTTASDDPDLDGRSGTVTIEPNPDHQVEGFLTHAGNKYALQTGRDGALRGYLLNVYMNGRAFPVLDTLSQWTDALTDAYLNDARQNGFETIFVHVTNHWFKLGAKGHDEHSSENPDRQTFEMLESIITRAHGRGMRVHLWAWGDESRKWTPAGVGGINGVPDRRLQRYIAARLGPLPGWSMGYGFDLHEWVSTRQLNAWAEYLHAHFGWTHLLAARGFSLGARGAGNINAYSGFGRAVEELTTTMGGPQNYREIVQDMESDTTRPHLYEERHTYNRVQRQSDGTAIYFYLNMEGTRRLLWWQAMAGGMGGFFGFYGDRVGDEAPPYDRPEVLRTHRTFWKTHQRFLLDMARANALSNNPTTRVLRSAGSDRYVFYREDAGDIQVDLSAMQEPQPAVAVDTRSEYKEIDVGRVRSEEQTIALPYRSDWAIAVGHFGPGVASSAAPAGGPRGGHVETAAYPENVARALSENGLPERPATYGLDYALEETRSRLAQGDTVLTASLEALRRAAGRALELRPPSVTRQGPPPPSGNAHDYASLPPYWWPDPDTESGLPYIRRDGEVNPTSERDDARALGRMARAVETLALAYALTGREAYAQRAARLLRTWFLDEETRMNPHLNFGQGVPGRSTGRRYGIIETRHLPQLVEAIGLVEPSPAWTTADHEGMRRWAHDYLEWLVTSDLGQKEARTTNNHGVWYDAQVAALALFTGEARAAKVALRHARQRLRSQVEPDGRQPEELKRTRSMTYTAMNTIGLMQLAALAEHAGVDLWHAAGPEPSRLRQAIGWLAFYADGTRPWPYEQITDKPWSRLVWILRVAARAYDDPAYEQLIRHVPEVRWHTLRMNLLHPPLMPRAAPRERTP